MKLIKNLVKNSRKTYISDCLQFHKCTSFQHVASPLLPRVLLAWHVVPVVHMENQRQNEPKCEIIMLLHYFYLLFQGRRISKIVFSTRLGTFFRVPGPGPRLPRPTPGISDTKLARLLDTQRNFNCRQNTPKFEEIKKNCDKTLKFSSATISHWTTEVEMGHIFEARTKGLDSQEHMGRTSVMTRTSQFMVPNP